MKLFTHIIFIILLVSSFGVFQTQAAGDFIDGLSKDKKNLNVGNKEGGGSHSDANTSLNKLNEGDSRFFGAGNSGEKGISDSLIKVARDLKNIFFVIATIYFLIIILRLLMTENSEEEFGKFKKGILWITIGIIVMQIAYSFVSIGFDNGVSGGLANNFLEGIVEPLIKLLETAASFFFIAIAIFAFYRIVSSSGDEEKAKSGKMSIFYAIIGFIVIKLAKLVVDATYSKTLCSVDDISCTAQELEEGAGIIFKVINWLNGFVGIAVVIMIIYVGAQIIFSSGEEEKIKKTKTAMIYIFVGITLLVLNYFILTFFLADTISA